MAESTIKTLALAGQLAWGQTRLHFTHILYQMSATSHITVVLVIMPSVIRLLYSLPGCSSDRKRPLRYMGDFSEAEMTSPREARKFLSIAKERIEVQKKRIKYLQTKESRLKKRIASLKSLLNDVKRKFNMSDSACSTLEVILT